VHNPIETQFVPFVVQDVVALNALHLECEVISIAVATVASVQVLSLHVVASQKQNPSVPSD
jgi:hypothetical protein